MLSLPRTKAKSLLALIKEDGLLKKWQKVILILLAIIIAIVLGFSAFFNFYVKDKIEDALVKVQQVICDPELQKEIDSIVNEMIESGELQISQLDEYMHYQNAIEQMDAQQNTEPDAGNATGQVPSPTDKPVSLYDRVKAEMTADEFAFAMYIYGKVDIGYVTGNIHSNREGVKRYIKSVLTSDEISKSLTIYKKYSYLLK